MCQCKLPEIKLRYLLIGLLIFLWWWVSSKKKDDNYQPVSIPLDDTHREASPPVFHREPASVPIQSPSIKQPVDADQPQAISPKKPQTVTDDLRRIEGIGPKISAVLNQAGITSFKQLARKKPAQLKAILEQAKIRLAQPDTWPEQASLASRGDWQGLEKLQEQLKGGRRV